MPYWFVPLLLSPFAGTLVGTAARAALVYTRLLVHPADIDGPMHEARGADLFIWNGSPPDGPTAARDRWFRFPLTIVACMVVVASMVVAGMDPVTMWAGCILGWTLLALAWIDLEHMILPDMLTLPLVVAGLGMTYVHAPDATSDHAAAAAAGYLSFRAIEIGYRHLRGQDALGQGDAKLMAAAGAWLGLMALPSVVFVAALIGLAMVAGLRLSGRAPHVNCMIPFGPALCAAIWLAWLGCDPLLELSSWLS